MLPQETFKRIKTELEGFDEEREDLIKTSRKLQSLAKKGMYEVHRGKLQEAQELFDEATPLAVELKEKVIKNHKNKIGAVTAALQEWGECYAYHTYAKEGRLIDQQETGLENEDYLLALADLTGELTRKAVNAVTQKNMDEARSIKGFIEELYGAFLSINFRNGELRKKTDMIRWNLQKVEELLLR